MKEVKSIALLGEQPSSRDIPGGELDLLQEQDFLVQWHLTERCNLSCRHCYQKPDRVAELAPEQVESLLTEIRQTLDFWSDRYQLLFKPALNLTGGEPLIYPDLWRILRYGSQLGFNCSVMTNGTLISNRDAELLKKLGVNSVQVSIEGTQPVHDQIRGENSFSRALQGVAALVAAGIEVTFSLTLTALNIDELPSVINIAETHRVARVGFSRLVPFGQGKELQSLMVPTPQYRELLAQLPSLRRPGVDIVSNDPLACLFDPALAELLPSGVAAFGCAAGTHGITVMPDGAVMPCRRMDLVIGNLLTTPFRRLWVESPVLQELRSQATYRGKCQSCEFWSACRGCRAVARALSADPNRGHLDPDPNCWYQS